MSGGRLASIADVHGHAKGEHRVFAAERPIQYTPRMLFLWFYHAARRGWPRRMMVSDHINYVTRMDADAVQTARYALALAYDGDVIRAAQAADVSASHAAAVSRALRDGMRFLIGIEADNDPRTPADAQGIIEAMRPDAIIRSTHFITIERPETGAEWSWPFDNPEFVRFYEVIGVEKTWELYFRRLLQEITLPCDVVGHFFVPAKFGHWPAQRKLEEYEDQLLEVCIDRNLAVELNTRLLYRERSLQRKEAYLEANRRLLRKAKACGVRIAVGSDAHTPWDQGNAFDVALELLDACRIGEVFFPGERR